MSGKSPFDDLSYTLGKQLPSIDYSVVTKYYPEKAEDPAEVEKFRNILRDGPHPLATNMNYNWWYFRGPRDKNDTRIASTFHYPSSCVAQPNKWSPMFQFTHKYPTIAEILRALAFDIEQHNELWTQRSYGLYMLGRFEQAMTIVDCVAYTSLNAPKPLSPQFHQQMTDTLARSLFRTGHYHDSLVVFLSQVVAGKEVDVDILVACARCALGLGDWYLALACLLQVARTHTRYARVWVDIHKLLLSLTHSIIETALRAGTDPCAPLSALSLFVSHPSFTPSPHTPLPNMPTPYHRVDEDLPQALIALAAQLWGVSVAAAAAAPTTALVRVTGDLLFALFTSAHRAAAYALSTNVDAHVGLGNHWNDYALLALLDTPGMGYQRVHQPSGAFADAVPLSAGTEAARVLRWGSPASVLLAGRSAADTGAAAEAKEAGNTTQAVVATAEVEMEVPGVSVYHWHPIMDTPAPAHVAALRAGDRAHNHASVCAAVDAAREASVAILERQYLLQEGVLRAARAAREAQATAKRGADGIPATPAALYVTTIDVGAVPLAENVVARTLRRVVAVAHGLRSKRKWQRDPVSASCEDVCSYPASSSAGTGAVCGARVERCMGLWTRTALERVVDGAARCEEWLRRDAKAVVEHVNAVHTAVGMPLRELVGAQDGDGEHPKMAKLWSPLMSVEACLRSMPYAAINAWEAEDKARKIADASENVDMCSAWAGVNAVAEDAMRGLVTQAMMPKLAHAVFFGKLYPTPCEPVLFQSVSQICETEDLMVEIAAEENDDSSELFTTTARPVVIGEVDEVDADGNLVRNRPRPMNPLAL